MDRARRNGIYPKENENKKSLNPSTFEQYLVDFFGAMTDQKEELFAKPIFRKLRLEAFCLTKKSEAKWIKKFRGAYGDGRQVTVIMGDWSAGHTFRGQVATKNKGFR